MNIDILTLATFIEVVNQGSFSRAADQMSRTQSAVSQKINKLEHSLGKKLLVREPKVGLTDEGEFFLDYAKKIISAHKDMKIKFKELDLSGDLRLGLPEDFAAIFLTDLLEEFVKLHKNIRINIECDLTINLYNKFLNREYDLVLLKMCDSNNFPRGLDIWSEKLQWVGRSHSAANLAVNKPIPLVLSPQPCVYRAQAIQTLQAAKIPYDIKFSSLSYASKMAAVRAGFGITILPANLVPKDLEIIGAKYLPTLNDIHVSLLKAENDNSLIDSFESFIYEKLRSNKLSS